MKSIRNFSFKILSVLVALSLASCASDEFNEELPSFPDTLLGRWQGVSETTVILDADNDTPALVENEGTVQDLSDTRIAINENGSFVLYHLSFPDGVLIDSDTAGEWRAVERYFWKFVSWDLILTDDDGKSVTYNITEHTQNTLALSIAKEAATSGHKVYVTSKFKRIK